MDSVGGHTGNHGQESRKTRLTKCVVVDVSMTVLALSNISLTEQTFDAQFVMRAITTNLQDCKVRGSNEPVTADNWEPRLRFSNLIDTSEWRQNPPKSLPNGELCFKYFVRGTFSEKFELGAFPFDTQRMTLCLSSAIPEGAIDLREIQPNAEIRRSGTVSTRNFAQSSAYNLEHEVYFRRTSSDKADSTSDQVRPMLLISMVTRRKPFYFVWNIVVPHLLINLMSLGVFAIPSTDTADRLSVSLTMVLTAVAFKLQVASDLPNLSYFTMMDVFILASFFYIFIVVLENIFVGYITSLATAPNATFLLNGWMVEEKTMAYENIRRNEAIVFFVVWCVQVGVVVVACCICPNRAYALAFKSIRLEGGRRVPVNGNQVTPGGE